MLGLLREARLRVHVGPDGVHLQGLWHARFVRYDDVAEVRPWQGAQTRYGRAVSEGFDLVLKSDKRIPLRTLRQRLAAGQTDDIVADQIEAAMNGRAERLEARLPCWSATDAAEP